ncbi:MAG TPA: putrescine-ornithine antiporter [Burkholderiales bacterium]|nr:putrescine-ornithine antiporter [Burkholderiales bacterium]
MASTSVKKMSMMQLTVVVAVNMMGSGIIMLPTNMAQVGAISLLSWIVTALGSMAIAYGFAQAGVFNQRPGGMAAYAEDAYGKGGYFLTFLLYFFSLAIGNVAIAISAVGYLAGFFPGMSATPIATCVSVIALIWLTTVANFGGPSITGKIGAVTVWGVIIPVAGLSVIGWFWFNGGVFMEAWNPKGMTLGAGMGSSIALTLWAFLGMESAAQNSDAVENPKRDVPLACMFGTLAAAAIYILSTAVIQGIVPNAELAKSTGPFALAYAKMFTPVVGSIIMGLAVLACLGSLLGWQFTIAQTAKTAAADRLFPTVFSKENRLGAPVAGMVIMGIVQTVMALSTISPSLSQQFSALVNLAVVTNVIPYIISLSALFVMMKSAGVSEAVVRRNTWITVIAMLYSTYAIYASGKDAVLGGTIVLALTYILYGFLAPRFSGAAGQAGGRSPARGAGAAAAVALALAFIAAALQPSPVHAQASAKKAAAAPEGAKKSSKLTFGYYANARPFSYTDESGKPAGYAVELCQQVAGAAGVETAWVAVTPESRTAALRDGKVNVLCGEPDRLSARKDMAFSIPIFQGGIGALLRADAPAGLSQALSERPAPSGPLWRGTPTQQLLQEQTFAVVSGTPAEKLLTERLKEFQLTAKVAAVKTFEEGVQSVLDRKAGVFFSDRSMLLDAAKRLDKAGDLTVLERRFTLSPLALALRRGDEDGRLAADRALSRAYATPEFRAVYAKWFGGPDESAAAFFRAVALPE